MHSFTQWVEKCHWKYKDVQIKIQWNSENENWQMGMNMPWIQIYPCKNGFIVLIRLQINKYQCTHTGSINNRLLLNMYTMFCVMPE